MRVVDFENNTRMGVFGHGGAEALTVTGDEAAGGSKSLLVSNRAAAWHGPALNVTNFIIPGVTYQASVWVKAKEAGDTVFTLSAQIGEGAGALYLDLDSKPATEGWVKLEGLHTFPSSGYSTLYITNTDPQAEFYIDDITFFAPSAGGLPASIALPSLHERYQEHFLLGSAFVNNDLSGPRFELVKRHFNALTAGNAMKPAYLGGGGLNDLRFGPADRMLEPILDAGIAVIGHTLVWHSQSADWLNQNQDGSFLTRAEARSNLEGYINAVAGHYAGRVLAWDVVNEAFQPNVGDHITDWRGGLRKGGATSESAPWYGAYENGADTGAGESGADYIYDAFVFARLADPAAVLYYNDYNEEYAGKREAIALMTEDLNEQWKSDPRNTQPDRLLIEGLGLQSHYWTNHLNPKDVEATIQRWIQTGAEISVTELDIPAGSWSRNGSGYKTLDEAEEKKQARLYAELFEIYLRHSDHIARVSIWGIDDPSSWRSGGSPLLFDENGTAKYAFYAVLDPAGYLAGDYDDIKTQTGGESTATPAVHIPLDQPDDPPADKPADHPKPDSDPGREPGPGPFALPISGLALLGAGLVAAGIVAVISIRRNK
jgi:endo-1,4-beta-xylanase